MWQTAVWFPGNPIWSSYHMIQCRHCSSGFQDSCAFPGHLLKIGHVVTSFTLTEWWSLWPEDASGTLSPLRWHIFSNSRSSCSYIQVIHRMTIPNLGNICIWLIKSVWQTHLHGSGHRVRLFGLKISNLAYCIARLVTASYIYTW